MNFMEAVAALQAGECEGIRAVGWNSDNVLVIRDGKLEFRQGLSYIPYAIDFGKDFQLVYPKPITETVEVKRYMITNPGGGVYSDTFMTKEAAECKAAKMPYPSGAIVELTGHYEAPVPPRVRKTVTLRVEIGEGELYPAIICLTPEDATLRDTLKGKTGVMTFTEG